MFSQPFQPLGATGDYSAINAFAIGGRPTYVNARGQKLGSISVDRLDTPHTVPSTGISGALSAVQGSNVESLHDVAKVGAKGVLGYLGLGWLGSAAEALTDNLLKISDNPDYQSFVKFGPLGIAYNHLVGQPGESKSTTGQSDNGGETSSRFVNGRGSTTSETLSTLGSWSSGGDKLHKRRKYG